MWQTYVAMGDSLTQGYGDGVAGVELRSWTDWIADALAALDPAFTYRNLGWVGSITTDVLRTQAPLALEIAPDLVSVTAGANDTQLPTWSADSFAHDFEQLLRPFAEQGVTLVTMTYPDLRAPIAQTGRGGPSIWGLYFQRMAATNGVIRQVSRQLKACLLDFESFAPLQNSAYISSDLVHPNALGYKQVAQSALKILAERFDLPSHTAM